MLVTAVVDDKQAKGTKMPKKIQQLEETYKRVCF
jgi:hypothetical protein